MFWSGKDFEEENLSVGERNLKMLLFSPAMFLKLEPKT